MPALTAIRRAAGQGSMIRPRLSFVTVPFSLRSQTIQFRPVSWKTIEREKRKSPCGYLNHFASSWSYTPLALICANTVLIEGTRLWGSPFATANP